MDFDGLVFLPPLLFQIGCQPISQETNAHMITHPVGPPVEDRAHLQVVLEVTKSILHLQEILVMTDHARAGNFLEAGVGFEQPSRPASASIKSVRRLHCSLPCWSTAYSKYLWAL